MSRNNNNPPLIPDLTVSSSNIDPESNIPTDNEAEAGDDFIPHKDDKGNGILNKWAIPKGMKKGDMHMVKHTRESTEVQPAQELIPKDDQTPAPAGYIYIQWTSNLQKQCIAKDLIEKKENYNLKAATTSNTRQSMRLRLPQVKKEDQVKKEEEATDDESSLLPPAPTSMSATQPIVKSTRRVRRRKKKATTKAASNNLSLTAFNVPSNNNVDVPMSNAAHKRPLSASAQLGDQELNREEEEHEPQSPQSNTVHSNLELETYALSDVGVKFDFDQNNPPFTTASASIPVHDPLQLLPDVANDNITTPSIARVKLSNSDDVRECGETLLMSHSKPPSSTVACDSSMHQQVNNTRDKLLALIGMLMDRPSMEMDLNLSSIKFDIMKGQYDDDVSGFVQDIEFVVNKSLDVEGNERNAAANIIPFWEDIKSDIIGNSIGSNSSAMASVEVTTRKSSAISEAIKAPTGVQTRQQVAALDGNIKLSSMKADTCEGMPLSEGDKPKKCTDDHNKKQNQPKTTASASNLLNNADEESYIIPDASNIVPNTTAIEFYVQDKEVIERKRKSDEALKNTSQAKLRALLRKDYENLSDEERAPFEAKATVDKERYENQKKQFLKEHPKLPYSVFLAKNYKAYTTKFGQTHLGTFELYSDAGYCHASYMKKKLELYPAITNERLTNVNYDTEEEWRLARRKELNSKKTRYSLNPSVILGSVDENIVLQGIQSKVNDAFDKCKKEYDEESAKITAPRSISELQNVAQSRQGKWEAFVHFNKRAGVGTYQLKADAAMAADKAHIKFDLNRVLNFPTQAAYEIMRGEEIQTNNSTNVESIDAVNERIKTKLEEMHTKITNKELFINTERSVETNFTLEESFVMIQRAYMYTTSSGFIQWDKAKNCALLREVSNKILSVKWSTLQRSLGEGEEVPFMLRLPYWLSKHKEQINNETLQSLRRANFSQKEIEDYHNNMYEEETAISINDEVVNSADMNDALNVDRRSEEEDNQHLNMSDVIESDLLPDRSNSETDDQITFPTELLSAEFDHTKPITLTRKPRLIIPKGQSKSTTNDKEGDESKNSYIARLATSIVHIPDHPVTGQYEKSLVKEHGLGSEEGIGNLLEKWNPTWTEQKEEVIMTKMFRRMTYKFPWDEITAAIGINEDQCKRRWRYMLANCRDYKAMMTRVLGKVQEDYKHCVNINIDDILLGLI